MSLTKNDVNSFFQVTKEPKKVEIMETINEENNKLNKEGDHNKLDIDIEGDHNKLDTDKDKEGDHNKLDTDKDKEGDHNKLDKGVDIIAIKKEQLEEIASEIKDSDLQEIDRRQKKKATQINLLLRMFKLLNFTVDKLDDLTNLTFPRETLLAKNNQQKLMELIPEMKEVYNSSYLTCLHDNSIFKQKYPGVNLVRQVLKCHHLALTPKIISNGYEKTTGKKRVSRIFKIEKQMF